MGALVVPSGYDYDYDYDKDDISPADNVEDEAIDEISQEGSEDLCGLLLQCAWMV